MGGGKGIIKKCVIHHFYDTDTCLGLQSVPVQNHTPCLGTSKKNKNKNNKNKNTKNKTNKKTTTKNKNKKQNNNNTHP